MTTSDGGGTAFYRTLGILRGYAGRAARALGRPGVREAAARALLLGAAAILLGIAAASRFILNSEKDSVIGDLATRTAVFAKSAGAAMFPRTSLFEIHFLVNTMMLDRALDYAGVMDREGLIVSHSDPELIGARDLSPEARAAGSAGVPLTQSHRDPSGAEYYYFSHPVIVGTKRLGTAVTGVSSKTLRKATAPLRQKLVIIFLASLAAVPLLLQMLALFRGERRISALRSAMMHTVSHEFNNAITVLDASLFLLKESEPPDPPESRRQLYDTLQFELRSLSRYVKNILNEARMESGRLKLQMGRLVLRDLVYKLVASMKPLMIQKGLSFYMDAPEAPVEVSADMEAISLVISNLIGNAVKYTPERGTISVRMAEDGKGCLNFLVENSGAGIRPEEIGKLKLEFYRTKDAKASASGFRAGLRISNELLQLHGSELGIKSEPGKSSTFYFSLPIADREAGPAECPNYPERS